MTARKSRFSFFGASLALGAILTVPFGAKASVDCYTYHVTSSDGTQQVCGVFCTDNTYYGMACNADIFASGYDIEYQESIYNGGSGGVTTGTLWDGLRAEGIYAKPVLTHDAIDTVDPTNENNPNDFVGAEHNALLDDFTDAVNLESVPVDFKGTQSSIVAAGYLAMADVAKSIGVKFPTTVAKTELAGDLLMLKNMNMDLGIASALLNANGINATRRDVASLSQFESAVAGIENLDTFVSVCKLFEDRLDGVASDNVVNAVNVAKYSRVYWENQGEQSAWYPLMGTISTQKAKGRWWKIVGADALGALAGGYVGAQIGGPPGAVIGAVGWGATCSLYAAAATQEQ